MLVFKYDVGVVISFFNFEWVCYKIPKVPKHLPEYFKNIYCYTPQHDLLYPCQNPLVWLQCPTGDHHWLVHNAQFNPALVDTKYHIFNILSHVQRKDFILPVSDRHSNMLFMIECTHVRSSLWLYIQCQRIDC